MPKCRVRGEGDQALARELSRVYVAVFQDLTYAYPDDAGWFEKDQARLFRLVEQRGPFQVFLVDLPALGKHLDQALASRAYRCQGLPLQGKGPGHVQMPQFLRQLYLRVFDESGSLKEDYDVDTEALFFLRQILYGAKRAGVQCSDEAVEKEITAFIQVDASLPIPEEYWSEENPPSTLIVETFRGFSASPTYAQKVQELPAEKRAETTRFLVNLDIVSRLMVSSLGPYSYGDWKMRHGPGVVSVPPPRGNKYKFVAWSERLESVYPLADCGFHDWLSWVDDVGPRGFDASDYNEEEPCSRLIDVPKTFLKPRLIAAEPGEHMWCQQNLKAFLYSRSQKSWVGEFVRFNDQTLNQRLCLEGSRTGRLATIDLSSASDRVSCHAVGNLFRSRQEILQALRASRTRQIRVSHRVVRDGHPKEEIVALRKFSTMGSACTFPVESLMFLAATLAAILTVRERRVSERNIRDLAGEVAVFGDDIVVPIDSRELLVRGLEVLDFKVNAQKSFWTGRFRESCGVDSYAGIDVTPAYYKSPYTKSKPESIATVVEVSNNFYARFMVRTSAAIASSIPWHAARHMPMVPMDSGICGVTSFVVPEPGTRADGKALLKRYNHQLQRTEYKTTCLSAKGECTPITDNTALLQFFTEEPHPFSYWKSGVKRRPRLKEKAKYLGAEALVSSKPVFRTP